jgi:hypothetical protein
VKRGTVSDVIIVESRNIYAGLVEYKRLMSVDRHPYPLIAAHSQPSQSTFIKATFLLIPMI